MRIRYAWLALTVLLAAAVQAAPRRNAYADCINGCWQSYEYCRQHQSKKIDCESQLGHCFDFCEDVYLPWLRTDVAESAADARDSTATAAPHCASPASAEAGADGEGPAR